MTRISSPLASMKAEYDAIVVGSGYGGGVAASRMARMGLSVAVLERGLEIRPGEYPDTPVRALEQVQLDAPEIIEDQGKPTALFDVRLNPDMNVLVGCGLGGTSLINANVSLRADPRVFDDPVWPEGLSDADLEEGYRRAFEMLAPVPYPETHPVLNKLKAMAAAGQRLGTPGIRPPINVTFEDTVNYAGVRQRACTLCGDCCSGCNVSAKNTTLMNYLPDAARGGAAIFCAVQVRWVERRGGRWVVGYVPLGLDRERFDTEELEVSANRVVLAAGTLGSTEILLRSRERGLALSPKLGSAFSGNGDVLAFGYNNDVPIDGVGLGVESATYDWRTSDKRPVGPTITGLIDLRAVDERDDGMVIEEGAIPGGLGQFLPIIMAKAARLFGEDTDTGDVLAEAQREVESLTSGPYRGAVNHTQTFLVMAHDGAEGTMRLDDDRLRVDWPDVGEKTVYKRIAENIREAVAATGGTYVPNPIWANVFAHSLVTVHPLGGCPMGRDAAAGVVDAECRVFDGASGNAVHPGLYVCDGSVMPRSLGVNPLLTITAVSERAMIRLAAREGRQIDMAPRTPDAAHDVARKPGVRFTEKMAGTIRPATGGAESDASFVVTVMVADAEAFIADPDHDAVLVGSVEAPAIAAGPLTIRDGRFNLFIVNPGSVETKEMRYAMPLVAGDGRRFFMQGVKTIHNDRGFDLWSDTSTLKVAVHEGADANCTLVYEGTLHIRQSDFIKQLGTMTVTDAPDLATRLTTMRRFGEFFGGQLFESFGGPFVRASAFDPNAVRPKRPLRVGEPELHFVETADGKRLRLTRYRGGDKGPVILSHGLGVSSLIFTIDTIDTNLLEFLYAGGFDCWVLDYRASVDLPYCEEQWNADDVARLDYPPVVDYVREKSGRPSVQMMAHCFGAMTFTMAMLSGLPHVRAAAISQISTHAVVPWWPQRLLAYARLPALMRTAGIDVVDARATVDRNTQERVVDALIGLFYPFRSDDRSHSLTSRRITALYGQLYQLSQLNQATFEALPEMFGRANVTVFRHLATISRAGHVVRADGTDDYLGVPNLRNFAIPTLFVHGALNRCFEPPGTLKTIAALAKVNDSGLYSRREIAETGHIDSIFGKNAARDVYPAILAHLNETATQWS